jgi:hypothetical protein
MLNRRAAALGNSVVFLWLYAAFQVAASTWSLIELLIRSAERAELPPGAPEILRESYNSGSAYAIYGIIGATLTIAVCVWLARRLTLPIIKAAYST